MKTMFFFWFSTQVLFAAACLPLAVEQPRKTLKAVEATAAAPEGRWKPATFRGLTMGTSTRADMLRILGEPEDFPAYPSLEENAAPDRVIEYFYKIADPFPGRLTIGVRSGSKTLIWVRLRPENLTKQAALAHFGPEYVVTRYDFDDCIDKEAVPIYESAEGKWALVEYRKRGIFFHVDEEGNVDEIGYVSEPPGAASSRCREQ